jgi:hypothetical protein
MEAGDMFQETVEGRENLCNDVRDTQQESAGGCLKKRRGIVKINHCSGSYLVGSKHFWARWRIPILNNFSVSGSYLFDIKNLEKL